MQLYAMSYRGVCQDVIRCVDNWRDNYFIPNVYLPNCLYEHKTKVFIVKR